MENIHNIHTLLSSTKSRKPVHMKENTPYSYEVAPSYPSLINLQDAFQSSTVRPVKREIIIPHRLGKPLGVRVCTMHGAIYIVFVLVGSLAWKIGLNPGDRIDSVNGHACKDAALFVKRFKETDGPVTLSIYDCPTERLRLHAEPHVKLGLVYKDWKIKEIIEGSAAKKANLDNLKGTHSIVAINDTIVLGWTDDQVLLELQKLWQLKHDLKLSLLPYDISYEMALALKDMYQ